MSHCEANPRDASQSPSPEKPPLDATLQFRIFSVIFFFSGATSLIYQVAWMRKLSLFFGSDVYSAAVTLSAFMGGLSLGSWAAGRAGRELKRPLFIYAMLEILIALYALSFAVILGLFDPLLTAMYRSSYVEAPAFYQVVRATVAFAILLPPTALMGATLPLVMQQFAVAPSILGARLGHFYATNTVGALFGTVVGGFILLPFIGVTTSIGVSAAINLAIGLMAIWLARESGVVRVEAAPTKRDGAITESQAHLSAPRNGDIRLCGVGLRGCLDTRARAVVQCDGLRLLNHGLELSAGHLSRQCARGQASRHKAGPGRALDDARAWLVRLRGRARRADVHGPQHLRSAVVELRGSHRWKLRLRQHFLAIHSSKRLDRVAYAVARRHLSPCGQAIHR